MVAHLSGLWVVVVATIAVELCLGWPAPLVIPVLAPTLHQADYRVVPISYGALRRWALVMQALEKYKRWVAI